MIRVLSSDNSHKWLRNLNLPYTTLRIGEENCFLTLLQLKLVSSHCPDNSGTFDLKMDQSVLNEKPRLNKLGFSFSSKLDLGSYVVSITNTTSKKLEP